MSQFYHIGGVFPGRHWQSSVFRRTHCELFTTGRQGVT